MGTFRTQPVQHGEPLRLYVAYREADTAGAAISLRRELGKFAPDVSLVMAVMDPGDHLPEVPVGATVLLLAGRRWVRADVDTPPYMAEPGDPVAELIRATDGVRIVPVLCGVPLAGWSATCRELPPDVGRRLAALNAVELRLQSFAADLRQLLEDLGRDRNGAGPWMDGGPRTVIQVTAGRGGLLKWYSNRNTALRVFVDDAEVGALGGWAGSLMWSVEPGDHTVQIRAGRLNPSSAALCVRVEVGATVALICRRNILTGGLTPARGR
jgi:hypothetical protein